MNKIVLIAGPTCSGKSKIALSLAQKINGVLINADSMQVYADIPILSAQPSRDDQQSVPHLLYGHVSSTSDYSTGTWLEEAVRAIRNSWSEDKVPIVVGGTGLYFEALMAGLANIPPIPEFVRQHVRALANRFGLAGLEERLRVLNALNGMPEVLDRQRASRALEVRLATGMSLGEWQKRGRNPPFSFESFVPIVLKPDRQAIYETCDARLDAMMAAGALSEVSKLAEYPQEERRGMAFKALGVPQLLRHLEGEMPLDAALTEAKTATRRYAKRQFTWIARHMIAWNGINEKEMEKIMPKIFSIIKENGLTLS